MWLMSLAYRDSSPPSQPCIVVTINFACASGQGGCGRIVTAIYCVAPRAESLELMFERSPKLHHCQLIMEGR